MSRDPFFRERSVDQTQPARHRGRARSHVARGVRSARTQEVVAELRRHDEYVVIDAPPILSVTDAFPFVVAVDNVIATVRSGRTTKTAAGELRTTLERIGARAIELMVTELDRPSHTYYAYRPPAKRPGSGIPKRSMRPDRASLTRRASDPNRGLVVEADDRGSA
jgi:hypothetical protein